MFGYQYPETLKDGTVKEGQIVDFANILAQTYKTDKQKEEFIKEYEAMFKKYNITKENAFKANILATMEKKDVKILITKELEKQGIFVDREKTQNEAKTLYFKNIDGTNILRAENIQSSGNIRLKGNLNGESVNMPFADFLKQNSKTIIDIVESYPDIFSKLDVFKETDFFADDGVGKIDETMKKLVSLLGHRDLNAILKRLSYEDKAEIVTKEMAKIMPSLGMEKSPENKMYFKKGDEVVYSFSIKTLFGYQYPETLKDGTVKEGQIVDFANILAQTYKTDKQKEDFIKEYEAMFKKYNITKENAFKANILATMEKKDVKILITKELEKQGIFVDREKTQNEAKTLYFKNIDGTNILRAENIQSSGNIRLKGNLNGESVNMPFADFLKQNSKTIIDIVESYPDIFSKLDVFKETDFFADDGVGKIDETMKKLVSLLGHRDLNAILKRLSYEDKAEIVTKEMAKIMPSLGMEKSPENKMYFKKGDEIVYSFSIKTMFGYQYPETLKDGTVKEGQIVDFANILAQTYKTDKQKEEFIKEYEAMFKKYNITKENAFKANILATMEKRMLKLLSQKS